MSKSPLLDQEARLIEEGLQAIGDGRYIDDEDLDAWLDGLDENPDLPIPLATNRCPPNNITQC